MTLFVIGLVAFAVGYLIFQGRPGRDPKAGAQFLRRAGTFLLVIIAVFATARGGVGPGLLFLAAAFFLARIPLRFLGGEAVGPRQLPRRDTSRVKTPWLDITLNRTSGEVFGRVLKGQFAGHQITDLSADDLRSLSAECRQSDLQSSTIVAAYLERVHGPSATKVDSQKAEDDEKREQLRRATSGLTRDEALDVLGLSDGANDAEITDAHRRMMMLVHPDRGGSDYLAAKINAAKAVLLKKPEA